MCLLVEQIRGERFNTLRWRHGRVVGSGTFQAFFQASNWYDDQDQQREQPRKHLSTSFNCVPDTFSDCQAEQIERTTKQEVLNSEALVLVELGGKNLEKCRGCPKCRSWVESRATGTCLDLGMKDIQAWQVWPSVEISVAFLVLQKSPKLPQTGRSPKCCQDHSKKAHEAERPWLFTVGHPVFHSKSIYCEKISLQLKLADVYHYTIISLYDQNEVLICSNGIFMGF